MFDIFKRKQPPNLLKGVNLRFSDNSTASGSTASGSTASGSNVSSLTTKSAYSVNNEPNRLMGNLITSEKIYLREFKNIENNILNININKNKTDIALYTNIFTIDGVIQAKLNYISLFMSVKLSGIEFNAAKINKDCNKSNFSGLDKIIIQLETIPNTIIDVTELIPELKKLRRLLEIRNIIVSNNYKSINKFTSNEIMKKYNEILEKAKSIEDEKIRELKIRKLSQLYNKMSPEIKQILANRAGIKINNNN